MPPETAWDQLVEELLREVRRQMSRRDRRERESLDVCQSIVRKLIGDEGRVMELEPPARRRFLRVLTRNKLVSYARRDKAVRRGGPDRKPLRLGENEGQPIVTDDPQQTLVEREFMGELAKALRALSEEERALMTMRIMGEPYEEIGLVLGIDAATARRRFSRLCVRLRLGFE